MSQSTASPATEQARVPDPAAAAVCTFTVVVLLLGLRFVNAAPASSTFAFIPVLLVAGHIQVVLGTMAVRTVPCARRDLDAEQASPPGCEY